MTDFIDQALFGYDDGHRLLQTSSRLSNYEKDLLLQLSDLAPGISRLHDDGYWTGIPLRETFRYALLRTWPAPEMPRPGCVWSHVLLISFERLQSLTTIDWAASFRRPESTKSLKGYSEPLALSHAGFEKASSIPKASQLIACIYRSHCSSSERLSQADLGLQALALWGQQWPALQCSFSFRTVEKTGSGRSWLNNFDMMVTNGLLRLQREQPDAGYTLEKEQEDALADDLQGPPRSHLRQFRVDYGQDMPLHPTWTAFLCSVQSKLRATVERPDHSIYKQILEEVGACLPERAEGLHLKTSLLSFGSLSPFELPLSFSIDALRFAASNDQGRAFPDLSLSDEAVSWLWESNPAPLLQALSEDNGRGMLARGSVLDQLLRVVPNESLIEGAALAPTVRRDLVLLRPELLTWSGLPTIPAAELADLLQLLSEQQIRELDVIRTLISTNDAGFAAFLCSKFPTEVLFAVCMEGAYLTHASEPHQVILRFVGEVANAHLYPEFVSRLTTTTALLAFAAMLGFINRTTITAGPLLWAGPLFSAQTNSPQHQLQTLQAFALALALEDPRPGSEALLEYSFEAIHEAMRDSRLDYQASIIVEAILPDVKWWRRWDNCHRLRVAVIRAYAYANLNPSTFFQLAKDQSLLGAMFHEIETKDKYHALLNTLQQLSR